MGKAKEPVGLQITIARLRKKIKQQELARQVGMSRSKLCSIEKGYTEPTEQELSVIWSAIENNGASEAAA